MNAWLITALVLLFGLALCGVRCMWGTPINRLIGLELASAVMILMLMALAEYFDRDFLHDLALTQALLSFGGGLVFVRYLERWQ